MSNVRCHILMLTPSSWGQAQDFVPEVLQGASKAASLRHSVLQCASNFVALEAHAQVTGLLGYSLLYARMQAGEPPVCTAGLLLNMHMCGCRSTYMKSLPSWP